MERKPLALLAPMLLLATLLTARSSHAGPVELAGSWVATGISAKWVDGEWGPHCGKKPASGGGGGSVTIARHGSELAITGGGRAYVTNQCWTTEPGMSVTAHTAGARTWKTVCQTGAGAPRRVTIATSLNATDDTITFYETGQYQFVADGKPCTASVGRYRTYKLVLRASEMAQAGASPKAGNEPEAAGAADRCAKPGPAKRVELTPKRRLLSPGDTFTFTASALDAAGCTVHRRPTWSVEGASGKVEVGPDGKVTIADDASEMEVDVRAAFGAASATARVEVASKERFQALLAKGESDEAPTAPSAPAAVASKSLGAEQAVAEDRASGRKLLFLGLLGAVAIMLGFAGVFVMRRAKRQGADAALRRTGPESSVPASGRRAAATPPPSAPAPSSAVPAEPMKKICPVCGRQYPERSQFCGQDGTSLIPLN